MGDGTKKNPYTREDVLRLIEENGGTAEGLDLSGKTFEEGINLRELKLDEIILKGAFLRYAHLEEADLVEAHLERANLVEAHLEGAYLENAHLEGAYLRNTHLEGAYLGGTPYLDLGGAHLEGAHLENAHLKGAYLMEAYLEGADLSGAHLEGANLMGTKFSSDVNLEDVDWGNYILDEEEPGFFDSAVASYRHLKTWYTNAGIYDEAGEFYYREMEAKRKDAQDTIYKHFKILKHVWFKRFGVVREFFRLICKQKDFGNLVRLWIYRLTCGYGERPWQVVAWGISVLFGLALLYFFLRGVAPYTFSLQAFSSSLYYSSVSFTALGYGPWFSVGSVRGWVQGVGAAEAIIGVFMIALFLVTFTKKMTR